MNNWPEAHTGCNRHDGFMRRAREVRGREGLLEVGAGGQKLHVRRGARVRFIMQPCRGRKAATWSLSKYQLRIIQHIMAFYIQSPTPGEFPTDKCRMVSIDTIHGFHPRPSVEPTLIPSTRRDSRRPIDDIATLRPLQDFRVFVYAGHQP